MESIDLKNIGKKVRLDVYCGTRQGYLPDNVVVENSRLKTEGQIRQELIHHLVSVNAPSGWYIFYLYDTRYIWFAFEFKNHRDYMHKYHF